jgi:hypothetical protein
MLPSMKRVETYRWRIQWLGRWTTTRHHASEEDMKIEHPEATPVPGTLIVREVPETAEEYAQQAARISFGQVATPAPGMPGRQDKGGGSYGSSSA